MKSNQKTRTFVSFSNHGAKKRCSSPTLHEISIIYPNDKQEGFNSSVENSLLCYLISYLVELSEQISLHIHALYRSNIEVTEICQYVRSAAMQVVKH
jgi:hypothetical protein